MRKSTLGVVGLACVLGFTGLALINAPASGTTQAGHPDPVDCEASCEDDSCNGECELDMLCPGVACSSSGCIATCRALGGDPEKERDPCNHIMDTECFPNIIPKDANEVEYLLIGSEAKSGLDWAVAEYTLDGTSASRYRDIDVVAGSSIRFRLSARARFATTIKGVIAQWEERDVALPNSPVQHAAMLVKPRSACVPFDATLTDRTFPMSLERNYMPGFRAIAAPDGTLINVELLSGTYVSLGDEVDTALLSFLLEKLRVDSESDVPIEVAGRVVVSDAGWVGYSIGGGAIASSTDPLRVVIGEPDSHPRR